jgi:N-acetylglucosamine-6-sulfatase
MDSEQHERRGARERRPRPRGAARRRWLGIGLLVALVTAVVAVVASVAADSDREAGPAAKAAPERPARQPNLLVVMTDDQTVGSFSEEVMPATREFFADGGTLFDQAIAAPPLCCPARAGFLTGRYAHNHRVLENEIGYGSMRGKGETFPVALQAAGYRTGMVGKFLNGYGDVAGSAPAPGFDRWYAMQGYADYFDFEVSDDGRRRQVARYATRELTDRAREFIDAGRRRPFFLWLSYNAPHTVLPGHPPPCDGKAAQPPSAAALEPFADVELPRAASFDQEDTSDRPSIATHPDRLGPGAIAKATRAWRCSLAAMRDVDEQLGSLLDHLRDSGRLEDTVVVYLSDNGYFYGEHRLTADKRLPLEPALRVPLAIRVGDAVGGGSEPPSQRDELVSQVDLAPTLLDYARAAHCPAGRRCAPLDGRSLRGLLEGEAWPEERAIPLTLADGWYYEAVRTKHELYIELTASRKHDFDGRRRELYDLRSDPDQLDNLAARPSEETRKRVDVLARRLADLSDCAGIEGRDPRSAGQPYCE